MPGQKDPPKFCVECDDGDPKHKTCDYANGEGCQWAIEWFFNKTVGRSTQTCL